jgi:hypothetical protein
VPRFGSRFAALLLLASLALLSCADRTSILVRVTSPTLDPPGEIDEVRFSIRGASTGAVVDRSFMLEGGWPQTLSIRPGPMEASAVTIAISGRLRGAEVATASVPMTAFVRGSEVVVEVVLGGTSLDAGVDVGLPDARDAGPPDVPPSDVPPDSPPWDAGCMDDMQCDDGVACTMDRCVLFGCQNVPDDALCATGTTCDPVDGCPARMCTTATECDDRRFCTGVETCDMGTMACVFGTSPCEDMDPCTDDACDEATDSCSHTTRDVDGDRFGDTACPAVGGVPATDCDDSRASVYPGAPDVCDGLDNDCTGGCDSSSTCCIGAVGSCTTSCLTTGSRVCGASCGWGVCSPPAEVCNGVDDDCNTVCDDGIGCCAGTSRTCMTSCGSTGTEMCLADCTYGACVPPAETCNGLDDDCDMVADDGFACERGSVTPCTTTCMSPGTTTCSPTCTAGACVPPAEICNGVDDDCDMMIDEGCPACPPCTGTVTSVFEPGGRYMGTFVPNAQTGSCGGTGSEFYLTFTLTSPSDVFITTHHAGGVDTVVYVRQCRCTGTEIGCNNDADGRPTSMLQLTALAAGTYQVFVDTNVVTTATIPVDIYINPTAVAGDRCGRPTRIAPGTTLLTGTTAGFSPDYIPDQSGACGFTGTGEAADRVYYFYLPVGATVGFNGCGAGNVYDETIFLRSVCTDTAPANQRACADDSCAGATTCGSAGLRSSISTTLSAGLYYFFADGYTGTATSCPTGAYSFAVTGI